MARSAQCILNETRAINGVSERFIENVKIILENYHNDSYVNLVLHTFVSKFLLFILKNKKSDDSIWFQFPDA